MVTNVTPQHLTQTDLAQKDLTHFPSSVPPRSALSFSVPGVSAFALASVLLLSTSNASALSPTAPPSPAHPSPAHPPAHSHEATGAHSDDDARRQLARKPPPARPLKKNRRGKLSPEDRRALEAKVQKRVDTFVTVELATELDLDEKNALKLLSAWREHRKANKEHRERSRAAARSLAAALDENLPDAAVKERVSALRATFATRPESDDLLNRTSSFLSIRQQGKLLLAYPQIRKEVRKMVSRARRHGKRQKR